MIIQNEFLNHKVFRFYVADITVTGIQLHKPPRCSTQLQATNRVTESAHSTHFLLFTCSHRNK